MPYLTAPPTAKRADRTILTIQYMACVAIGVLAAFIREEPGISLLGWILLASSIPCAIGAITGRWEIESIGIWPLVFTLLGSLVLIEAGPSNVVWWVVLAFDAALVRQWLRLYLQLRQHIRHRRLLHSLDAGGAE